MNKLDRNKINKPECLDKNAVKWTKSLIQKRQNKPDYWYWHKYKNEKVEHILAKVLSVLSSFHCSYCGIYPLRQGVGGRSIDHYKPKSEFPELAFEWTNLFIACPNCQSYKKSDFPINNENLKIDSPTYNFDYWFKIDWINNYIIPQTRNKTMEEQENAQKIIDWFGLNKDDRPEARYEELQNYLSSSMKNVWKWSYPFFLERDAL